MRLLLTLFALFLVPLLGFTQAKKPTLMVLPSDQWCDVRMFITEFDNQGTRLKVPDYKKAFQEDNELSQVIAKIGSYMVLQGFPLKDAEQELKAIDQRNAEDNMTSGSTTGASLAETPLDMLKKRSKADIIIQIWWKVNKEAAGKSVSFTIQAFDAYTSKQIASTTGTGPASNEIVPVLLMQAVQGNIEAFMNQLQLHFDDMAQNGREITVRIKRWEDWTGSLESEYDGKALDEIIENWMTANTVKGRFNTVDVTENMMIMDQVRIPLFDESGKAIDARHFTRELQRYLKSPPLGIDCKLMSRGLGEAIIVLGAK